MLGIIWVTFRIVEALIQIYYKKSYWGLLDIARQYTGASGADKNTLIDLGNSILKTKNTSFSFAQVLFSIGTLAYSILFVTYGVVPAIIGWFGIVASILYGLGNGMTFTKTNLEAVLYIGALFILLFEIILGVWLLFVHTVPS
jgi:hypothetical protein